MNDQGTNYVKQQLNSGVSPKALRQAMVNGGWKPTDVDILINNVLQEKTRNLSPAVAADMARDDEIAAASATKPGSKVGLIISIIIIFLVVVGTASYFYFKPNINWSIYMGISSPTPSPSSIINTIQPTLTQTVTDSDNDGLSDTNELIWGTNPNNPDTDGDGHPDGSEVCAGYNPLGAGKFTAAQMTLTKPLNCP